MKHEPTSINVLAVGYGRDLFREHHPEQLRLRHCAQKMRSFDLIIFSHRTHQLRPVSFPEGLTIHPTNSRWRWLMPIDAIRLGWQLCKKRSTSVWVISGQDAYVAGVVAYCIARLTRHPLNIQEHSGVFASPLWRGLSWSNQFWFRVGAWLLRQADSVRVVSQATATAIQKLGVSPRRIRTLAVRTDTIPKAAMLAPSPRTVHDSLVIITLARLVRQKNLELLISSFATVHQLHPATTLKIVGRGPEAAALAQLAARLNLSNAVEFADWTDEPFRALQEADIYALSSDWEGWGRVLIEAMAAGLPIVTTNVGCAGEVLKDGVHGIVVPVADRETFTTALLRLVEDSELRQQFGNQAQKDIRAVHISEETYANQWAAILAETVDIYEGQGM